MADTPLGETATPGDSKTEGNTGATPQVNATDNAEVERLRKEAEQARMRANQLENELAAKRKAEEDAERKRLEEKEEWKSLAEQEKAKREALEQQREAEAREKATREATESIYSEFPDAVKEIASEAGLSVSDDSEEAKEALKAKLQKIADKLPTNSVGPNNPANPTSTNNLPSGDEMKMALKNEQNFHDLASKLPSVNIMLKKRS